jgi:hypothetical protein
MVRIRSAAALACALALAGCGEREAQQPLVLEAQPAPAGSGRTEVAVPAPPPSVVDAHAADASTTPPAPAEPPSTSASEPTTTLPVPGVHAPLQGPDAASTRVYAGPGDSTPGRGRTGSLYGIVRFEGEEQLPPLIVAGDHATDCAALDRTDPSLLVGSERGLANVVLTIRVAGRSAAALEAPAVMERKGCRFEPHVLLVPVGSTVRYSNADTCSAMLHTHPKGNQATNALVPSGGEQDEIYSKADTIAIKDDVHPWMGGWVVVTDAPFHTLTGPNGHFELHGLPAGPLQLSLWHERLGEHGMRVDIVADRMTEVRLSLPPR